MRDRDPFGGEPSDTTEEIMRGTYRALQRDGYAGLSLQRIADEADLSKSSVYHFFDDKDELLVAFLDFMVAWFEEEFRRPSGQSAVEDLRAYLVHAIAGSPPTSVSPSPPEHATFGPFIELRAQAVTSDAFRERFSDLDAMIEAELASIVERGIDRGEFREVDPERTATVLLTLFMGAILRRSTADGLDSETLMDEVDTLLERYLLPGE